MTFVFEDIPIIESGQLTPKAGMLILGYMLYPNCKRSAHQFAQIVAEETIAKASEANYQPGQIFTDQFDTRLILRLILCGQVALRMCRSQLADGNANLSKAAHVVSELNATNKTKVGKPLPTDEARLRKTFAEYRPSIHFWAAANVEYQQGGRTISGIEVINEMQTSPEFLGKFLSVARQMEEILHEAKPAAMVWSTSKAMHQVWDIKELPKARLLSETIDATKALASYKSRPK